MWKVGYAAGGSFFRRCPRSARRRSRSACRCAFSAARCTCHSAASAARSGDVWRDQGLVFPGPTGELLPTSTVDDHWRRELAASGLAVLRFHDLRHTHATLLLAVGVHPKIVSERLGHANMSMALDTYSHITLQMQQGAADAFAALLKAS